MGDQNRSEAEPSPSHSDGPAYQLHSDSERSIVNAADPQWKVELSSGGSRRRRPIGPVCTFGGATRFAANKGPLTNKTSAPDGDHFYSRNEMYGRDSCLNGRKKFGRLGKGKREFGDKGNASTDEYLGPGSHVVTGAVLSQTGRASPLDGKQFCDFTLKSKAGFKSRPMQSCDVIYKLPSTLGTGGAGRTSKGAKKSPFEGVLSFVDKMYDPEEPKFGGTKEFLRTTFNNDRRFRGLFATGGDDRDIYYGKVLLGKDDWMSQSRASSFGARLRPPKSQWGPHLGPGTYQTNTDDPCRNSTKNVHFREAKEWKESFIEEGSFRDSFISSFRTPHGSSLRWSNKEISASQRSLP